MIPELVLWSEVVLTADEVSKARRMLGVLSAGDDHGSEEPQEGVQDEYGLGKCHCC